MFLVEIRERLEQAIQQHKAQYDKHYREVIFNASDWVWLRLLQRPLASMDVRERSKLRPRFHGPFQVLERIDDVAYRLLLPVSVKLHNVFHVRLLKPFRGEPPASPAQLDPIHHGHACAKPQALIKECLAWVAQEVLVHCAEQLASNASCMPLRFSQLAPNVPARGRTVRAGQERCYVRTLIHQETSSEDRKQGTCAGERLGGYQPRQAADTHVAHVCS